MVGGENLDRVGIAGRGGRRLGQVRLEEPALGEKAHVPEHDKDLVALLQAQLAAGWDTAEMHWVLSLALRKSGQAAQADAAASAARARNPLSEKMYGSAPS